MIAFYFSTVRTRYNNITERVKAEKNLRASEARYSSLYESNHSVMLLINPKTSEIVDANPAACHYYGYSRELLTSFKISDINILSQEQINIELQHAQEEKRNHFFFKHRLANDQIRDVEVYSGPIIVQGENLLFSVIHDITKRVKAEEDKRQMEVRLRQQQKLELIGTLASGIAHEINNPITGIMNYAQLIHDRIDPGKEQLREFSNGIIEETERVAAIVNNLLTFSQQDKQSHSPAQIADIVDNSLSLIGTVFRSDQITLEIDIPDDLPELKCRSQQIQQVLMNLLTNARDALNERYPEYDLDKVILLSVHPFEKDGRHWLRTTVEDHGVGIPEKIQGRIFDPFFTTKDRTKGTGLGLSISLGIAKDHHGELTFESVENKYTRFYLDLPIDNGWDLVK